MTIGKKDKAFYLVINTEGKEFTIALSKTCNDVLKALENEVKKRDLGMIFAYRKAC